MIAVVDVDAEYAGDRWVDGSSVTITCYRVADLIRLRRSGVAVERGRSGVGVRVASVSQSPGDPRHWTEVAEAVLRRLGAEVRR